MINWFMISDWVINEYHLLTRSKIYEYSSHMHDLPSLCFFIIN